MPAHRANFPCPLCRNVVIVTLEAEPDPEPPLVSVTDPSVTSAAPEAAGEAEQKAARRLGVPAFAIALETRRRWQRSLSAEQPR